MNQTARRISIYAADTSGFCSALYEYGGMTVIHDASGCNSTYTTHDEPRWYENESMMYISGLTENDAVMGNDEKFISDLVTTAEQLHPAFIAICASPMPAMIGIDMEAIAYEVESRTGIPSFNVRTNGMQSYIQGAADAFLKLSERFTEEAVGAEAVGPEASGPDGVAGAGEVNESGKPLKVNILGMTPLDFPLGTENEIKSWLESNGLTVNACIGMGTSLDEVRRLSEADVSLVVASSGRPLAESLLERFDIPFVVGVPYGKKFADKVIEDLKTAAAERRSIDSAADCRLYGNETAIVGESVLSTSLAAALSLDKGIASRVLESVGEGDLSQLSSEWDISCDDEDMLEKEIGKSEVVVADPLFEAICHGKSFVRRPHDAFSGRCFSREHTSIFEI
ncbi:MAG: oxidoreductase [Eubacterium sp.]|nr:oxidoreductase [Eubacterium sp.]